MFKSSKSSITLAKFYAYLESWITSWVHLFWNTFFLNLLRIFIGIHRRIQKTSNMKLFYHNSALKICSCYSNQLLNVLVTCLCSIFVMNGFVVRWVSCCSWNIKREGSIAPPNFMVIFVHSINENILTGLVEEINKMFQRFCSHNSISD